MLSDVSCAQDDVHKLSALAMAPRVLEMPLVPMLLVAIVLLQCCILAKDWR